MKRILSLLSMAVLVTAVWAQRLDITLTDKSVMSVDLSRISYMEVVNGADPGQLDGVWYLGYRVLSNGGGAETHYDGTEVLTFTKGPKLKWAKTTTETIYDLTYDENNKSFSAVPEGGSTKTTYSILHYEDNLLVLKQGTTLRYFYKSKQEAINTERIKLPVRNEYTDADKLWAANIKGGASHSVITPMGKHFEKFSAATDADRAWLADPNNQPSYTQDGYDRWTAKAINLYPFGDPVPADVNQHAIGDCCMCAVFASLAYIYPDFIKNIITRDGNNFTVKMFDPMGHPVDVVVDNKLLCNSGGGCAQVSGKNNVFTWSTIMEKALMKWETVFKCNGMGGIGTEHAAPPFTGCGDSYSFDRDRLFNDEFNLVVDYALSNGLISVGGFGVGGLMCGDLETITGHAFTVMYANPDERENYRFVMRNPWGNGGKIDGKLMIPNKREILKTIDFRLVYPGAAAPFKRKDLEGYTVPKFAPMPCDIYPSPEMLKMYNLESYGPRFDENMEPIRLELPKETDE